MAHRLTGAVRGRGPARGVALGAAFVVALGAPAVPARAQANPVGTAAAPASADAVAVLRRERQALEAQMTLLQRTARSLADELANLEAQREATARLLAALDRQLADINDMTARAERSLARTESELAAKRGALRQRLVAVYKRGQLHTVEVLLSAQSFAGLVARYKYLHGAAAHDRELVRRVERLRSGAVRQRRALDALRVAVQRTRAEKDREAQRLAELEGYRARSLAAVTQSTDRARARLARLGGPEGDPAGVAGLDDGGGAGAIPAAAEPPPPPAPTPSAVSSLAGTDRGQLEWPVAGGVLYPFGRTQGRNQVTVRWNGIGIRAPQGTPVRSVAAGDVALAGPLSTYGNTVIVQHGGGDYTVYGSLAQVAVRRGQRVARGETVGTVGAADPSLPAHLHFELRPKGRAVDPLAWLRRPAGGRD